jgi:hypothetical protein
MKNWMGIWLLSICSIFIWAQNDNQGQKNRNPDANEIVEVINVEMIARVQKNGQPFGGLQKSDFILKENGRPVEINGFREVHRRISRLPINEEKATAAVQNLPERLFVLCFWLRGHESECLEALDHFFRDIFRPGDHVILVHDNDTLLINSPDEITPVRAQFEAALRKGIEQGNNARTRVYDQIDDAINEYKNRDEFEDPILCWWRLQKKFDAAWMQFRLKFLNFDPGSLIHLADSLKSIHLEKWVLVFLQEEVFPGGGKVGGDVTAFTDKMRSSFIAADVTFSLIRLGSSKQAVYSSRNECFQKISRFTGGAVITEKDLTRGLTQAADKEDICYIMSFVPEDSRKKREIRLTCRDKSLEVFASRHIYSQDPREMAISDVNLSDSKLIFSLSGYTRLLEAGRLQGRVLVLVTANGAGALKVESSREFTLTDPVIHIPVSLNLPRDQEYAFKIWVMDLVSGFKVVKKITLRNM